MAGASKVAGNGEVRVDKVDKLAFVYNAVPRPPRPATVIKQQTAADVAFSWTDSGTKLVRGASSAEDIYDYLKKKKWEFLHGV